MPCHFRRTRHELRSSMTGVCRFHCCNLRVTGRHRVAYRLRTAAEGPDGTEQWWTVEKCRQRRVVAQGRILGVHTWGILSFRVHVNSTIVSYRIVIQKIDEHEMCALLDMKNPEVHESSPSDTSCLLLESCCKSTVYYTVVKVFCSIKPIL